MLCSIRYVYCIASATPLPRATIFNAIIIHGISVKFAKVIMGVLNLYIHENVGANNRAIRENSSSDHAMRKPQGCQNSTTKVRQENE